jgi:hypothetical protein
MSFWHENQDALPDGIQIVENPQTPVQNRVDAEFDQMAETTEVLSDVEKRLHKANLYRLILENPLIESNNDPLAVEVESEIRNYVIGMLRKLMGISNNEAMMVGGLTRLTQFTEEEVKALKLWANKLMSKPSVMKIEPKINPSKVAPAQPAQAALNPITAPKRGPGRPPGSVKKVPVTENNGKKTITAQLPNGTVEIDVTPPARPLHVKPLPMPTPEQALAMGMAQASMQQAPSNSMVGLAVNHFTNNKRDE